MDFFQAQDKARSRTKLLVFYFTVAVVLIVAAVYCAVTAGVYYYHNQISNELPAFFSLTRFLVTGAIVVPAIAVGSFSRIRTLQNTGGPGVAESLGGRRMNPSTKNRHERVLMNVVEEMAIASGVPIPAVYLLEDEPGINAFAAGFGIDDAAIGVTRGALEQLDRDELQGVIAHEFSHILNGDMRLSTKLSGWIYGIMMLSLLGRGLWQLFGGGSNGDSAGYRPRPRIYVGRSGGGGGRSKGGAGALIMAVIIVIILVTIIGFIGEFFARLIQAAVSRQREYLADASAVQFTRNPGGIGNALRRIGGITGTSVVEHPSTSQFAHAFFSKSLKSEVSFLATHPPLNNRIARVLANWQGDFLQPRKPSRPMQAETQPKRARPLAPIGQTGEFQQMLTAGLFMHSIGQLREQGRAYAEAARARLEDVLPHAFKDANHSPVVVLSLLMEHLEPVASAQRDCLATRLPDLSKPVAEEAARLSTLDRRDRLILLELMSARLPEALAANQDRLLFMETLQLLVKADNHVSTFEVACMQMVARRLFPISEDGRRTDDKIIIEAARILSTRLARETSQEDAAIAVILQQASRQAPYFMNQLMPSESISSETIEHAFADMTYAPLGIRRQFLEVCERIVAADEQVTITEVELLRAIALSIGIPAAPIFPETADLTSPA